MGGTRFYTGKKEDTRVERFSVLGLISTLVGAADIILIAVYYILHYTGILEQAGIVGDLQMYIKAGLLALSILGYILSTISLMKIKGKIAVVGVILAAVNFVAGFIITAIA